MFFKIDNKKYLAPEYLRTNTLLNAYVIIKNYSLHASELILSSYIEQQYKRDLKNMCIELLLNLTCYKDDAGNLILMFKDPKYDAIARLVTYGNGALRGSQILQIALSN